MPKKNKESTLRLVREVVRSPGATDRQLRLNLGADVGALAPELAEAERTKLVRHYRVGGDVVVYPTIRALDLVLGERKPARSVEAVVIASTARARKTGGAK